MGECIDKIFKPVGKQSVVCPKCGNVINIDEGLWIEETETKQIRMFFKCWKCGQMNKWKKRASIYKS